MSDAEWRVGAHQRLAKAREDYKAGKHDEGGKENDAAAANAAEKRRITAPPPISNFGSFVRSLDGFLERNDGEIEMTDIAEEFDIDSEKATEFVKRLHEKGKIYYDGETVYQC